MTPAAALPTVLVTRPQPQAGDWVARLQALGAPAQALPLMRIVRREGFDAAVRAAWSDLARHRLVMFVSPNAVLAFFAGRPEGAVWPAQTLAGATGPGTVAALRAQGVEARSIAAPPPDAARFDAESLWLYALAGLDWSGQSALIVRGEDGRDWLAATLRQAGACVACLAAYARAEPVWTAAECAALAAAGRDPAAHAWLFSSSQCIAHLLRAPAQASLLAALRQAPVLATHPRIAETARQSGFLRVEPVRPDPDAVFQALERLA
jgi:uroporphyrinogen-III synthase